MPELARRLGLADAVVIGLGAMVGAGVFAAFAPAARAAGAGLLLGLGIAAVIAYCNATSSARLAARYPRSGGTYIYGRERLGPFWGYVAGWGFVVGKTASGAAMALTVAAYSAPSAPGWIRSSIAVGVVLALIALNYRGVQKSVLLTRVLVSLTLAVLVAAVIGCFAGGAVASPPWSMGWTGVSLGGVLEAAGLLFFAFAGYARIATLGEEVVDPQRTIPRAVPIALGIALLVYLLVALAVLAVLGPSQLAVTADPLAAAVGAGSWSILVPVVRVGAVLAAVGSLLSLILGISRTTLAMARDGHLPRALAVVHPRFQVPHRAEVAVGVAVALLASLVDLRQAIGFSSFTVLVYYAIANASALTLGTRLIPSLGLVGCAVLAISLPGSSVIVGSAVLVVGAGWWWVRSGRDQHQRGGGQPQPRHLH